MSGYENVKELQRRVELVRLCRGFLASVVVVMPD